MSANVNRHSMYRVKAYRPSLCFAKRCARCGTCGISTASRRLFSDPFPKKKDTRSSVRTTQSRRHPRIAKERVLQQQRELKHRRGTRLVYGGLRRMFDRQDGSEPSLRNVEETHAEKRTHVLEAGVRGESLLVRGG